MSLLLCPHSGTMPDRIRFRIRARRHESISSPVPDPADGVGGRCEKSRTSAVRGTALAVAAFVLFNTLGRAQEPPATASPAPTDSASAVRDLQDQVRQLRSLVEEMRAENAESRAEMHQLRQDLQATRALLERPATSRAATRSSGGAIRHVGSDAPDRSERIQLPRAQPRSKNAFRSWKNPLR